MLERDKTPSVDDDRSKLSSQAQQPPQSACVHCRSPGYSTLFQLHYCAASAAVMALCQPASTVKPGFFFLKPKAAHEILPSFVRDRRLQTPEKRCFTRLFFPPFSASEQTLASCSRGGFVYSMMPRHRECWKI